MKISKLIKKIITFCIVVSNLNVSGMEVEETNFWNLDDFTNMPETRGEENDLKLENINSNNNRYKYKCGYKENLNKYQGINNKIVLYCGHDCIYKWTEESQSAMFYLLKNLPHDIKWKMSVDGMFHCVNNCLVFDEERENHKGEVGWHDSMMETWDFIANNIDSKAKINAEFYNQIHDKTVKHIAEFENEPEEILGFKWNSKFGVSGTLNGLIEFFIKSSQLNKFSQNSDKKLILKNSKVVKNKKTWPYNLPKTYIANLDAYHSLVFEKYSNDIDNRNLQKAFDEYDNEIKKINNSCNWEFGFSYNEYVEGFEKIKKYFRSNFEQLRANLISIDSNFKQTEVNNKTLYSDGKIKESFLNNLSFEYPYIEKVEYMPLINQFNKPKCTKNVAIIGAIVRLTQDLDQAHPFRDGNIRSAYSLFKLLLIKNNILPSLLYDPNNLDFHDTHILLKIIQKGQKRFVDLLTSNKDLILKKLGIEIQVI